ncbi:hypothetical protein SAMN05421780_101185 [Flexibacter flexilis DSM 6793]|uniref:N-acetyltransferase domain-containing protein n=1 Tax=Flexibacter flexilis DSM 6793 TaxID=927664 RepID=A0A1I1DFB9_9BACT|nr:hypothetical protein [Flexibacter flexilis]SFB73689.1 hypothetical protein SAMN05421780_101185 [Flexibacter flexilis DSM 6793]
MEVKSYNKKALFEFINSEIFLNLSNLPISRHRAISQINNPRASDDDILLIVQFDGNKVVGYMGMLPDYVHVQGKQEKIYWFSCFWVDDEYKSKNVAANLFLRSIRACKMNVFITNIVPWLEPVYQKTKIFKPTIYKNGYRGYLRFNLTEILPPKSDYFKKATILLKAIDGTLNFFNGIRLLFFVKYKLDNIRYEYLHEIDSSSSNFIDSYKIKHWTQRGVEDINWIIKNPWIIEGANTDFNSSRYYFSSLDTCFFYQIIKFYDSKNNMIGIMMTCVRGNNLTVPYAFFEENYNEIACKFLINKMIDLKLNMITIFNKELVSVFNQMKTPFLFHKEIKKPYLISKNFDSINDLSFQDGDGDCAFY